MLDDCSKTRCHNGQPCLAHLQCSTSFVLSPKYYPAMNYSGGTKLFQTWKGFDQNCSMGMRQIFSTLTTLTHSTGSCQLNNDNCEYVNILDDLILAKTVFFFNWKAWKQDWFCRKKVKLAKGRGCVTTKLERLREWNDFSTSCKSWKGVFTLPSEKAWNKGWGVIYFFV